MQNYPGAYGYASASAESAISQLKIHLELNEKELPAYSFERLHNIIAELEKSLKIAESIIEEGQD